MRWAATSRSALKVVIWLVCAFVVATPAAAATRYVRAGASGAANGSDWTNAYPSLPATLTRGDTYYVAGGTYSGYRFSTPASGTTLITIKRATIADHGTTTGWSDSFGQGQAFFAGSWDFSSSYWLIDGQVGGGPGSWTTGFGFKVKETADTVISIGSNASNITIRHVEAEGNGGDGDGGTGANDIFNNYTAGTRNVTVSYAYFYNAGRCIFFSRGSNMTFEYIYTGYHESTPGQHSEVASIWTASPDPRPTNYTFRYNVFTHAEGTGGLIMDGDGLYVYGNVFYRPTGDNWEHGNGVIGTWTVNVLTQAKVYNNTFINLSTGWSILGTLFTAPTTGNEARNNIFYGSTSIGGLGSLFPTFSHNYYVDTSPLNLTETGKMTGSGNPFNNYPALDFRLKAAGPAGIALPAPYDRDMYGTVRGSGGAWGRGAVEFGGGTTTTSPGNPSNLTLN
jgi:hypothetical protein